MATRPPVTFIDNRATALRYLDEAAKQPYAALDTEFDPPPPGQPPKCEIWSYSWGRGIRRVVTGDLLTTVFADWICDKRTRKVYQNAKADLEVFEAYGLEPRRSYYADIMVMDWLHDENDPRHGLKHQCLKWLNWRRREYQELFSYVPEGKSKPVVLKPSQLMSGDLPADALKQRSAAVWREIFIAYSSDDAESTFALYLLHRKYLESIGYWDQYLLQDKPFTITLVNVEDRGMPVDLPYMQKILRRIHADHLRAKHALRALIGRPDFNPNGDAQLKALFFGKVANKGNAIQEALAKVNLDWPIREDLLTESGAPMLDGKMALPWYVNEALTNRHYKRECDQRGERVVDDETCEVCGPLKANYQWHVRVARTLQEYKKAEGSRRFAYGIYHGVSDDGFIRTELNQTVADTGRISARKYKEEQVVVERYVTKKGVEKERTKVKKVVKGFQGQNVPRKKEADRYGIRKGFVAPPPGWVPDDWWTDEVMVDLAREIKATSMPWRLNVADYGGVELLMAIDRALQYTDDSKMLKLMDKFGSPSAIHANTAIDFQDLKCGHSEVKKLYYDAYDVGKQSNFSLIYKCSAPTLAIRLGERYRLAGQPDPWDVREEKNVKRCKEYIRRWYELYPEMATMQESQVAFGYEHGYVTVLDGFRVHVKEGLASDDDGTRHYWERKCVNTPCQRGSAAITKMAMNMIETDPELKRRGSRQIGQVHDEIISMVPAIHAAPALERKVTLMKMPFSDRLKVKLVVDGRTGDNWSEAKG